MWKSRWVGGWGVFELRILRGVGAQAVLEIQVEGGGKKTVPSVMGLWIFSGITHSWSLWQSDKCLWFSVTCGMKNKCMMPSSLWETCGEGMTPGYSQQYTGIIYLFLLHFREFFSAFVLQIEFMKWNIKLRYTRPLLSYGLLFLFLFWFLFWLFLFLFPKSGLWVLTVIYFGFNSTSINCKNVSSKMLNIDSTITLCYGQPSWFQMFWVMMSAKYT